MTLTTEEMRRREKLICDWLCADPDVWNQVARTEELPTGHLDEHRWLREAHAALEEARGAGR